jgi:hypothetical protein
VSANGNAYRHLLDFEDRLHNFLGDRIILDAVEQRFASHKAGDRHRVMTNTVASTPLCFNLFVPLQRDRSLASTVCSRWLGKHVDVAHVEIEFTPNHCVVVSGFEPDGDESLGDQSGSVGTDADGAVFFADDGGRKGVLLIEVKYIEGGFSTCDSYKRKAAVRPACDAAGFHDRMITSHLSAKPSRHPGCGYLRYENWSLTAQSRVLDGEAVTRASGCPFRGSGQQLWRNLLLAEKIAKVRGLDEFHFHVLAPVENTFLWEEGGHDVGADFSSVLTALGQTVFQRIELRRDVVDVLRPVVRGAHVAWLSKFVERYVP